MWTILVTTSGTRIINRRIIQYFPDEREWRLQYTLGVPAKVKKPLCRPQPGSSPSGLVPWRAGDVHHEAGWKGCGPLCQQRYRRNEQHLHWLSQTAVLLRQALVLCYIPAFKPWVFYLWLPKCQSLRGVGEESKMPQVLKIKTTNTESHSAWLRNCFSLKPVGKHVENTQGNKTNVQAKAVSHHWQSTHQKWDSPVQSLALEAGEVQSKTKAAQNRVTRFL